MKLIFLGTGHGVPGVDRFCSATLLECGGKYYLIDCGAPVAQLLIRYGIAYEDLKAVFITHAHDDHTFGLPHLLSLGSWYYVNSEFPTYLSDYKRADALRNYLIVSDGNYDEKRFPLRAVEPGVFYQDENIKVEAVPTDHVGGDFLSFAFVIEGEGKRVVFTGDMHTGDPYDFPIIATQKPTDAIVCELVHFGADAIIEKLEKCPTKQVLFNHYHEEWAFNAINEMKLAFPTVAMKDGDIVTL